jgi:hypothetical protein
MDGLRDALAEVLDREPQEDVVAYLEKKGMAGLLSRGEAGLDQLEDEYLELERQFPNKGGVVVWDIQGDERSEALSRILAAEAGRREDVSAFRKNVLRGRLLEPEGVRAWVKSKSKPVRPSRASSSRGSARLGGFLAEDSEKPPLTSPVNVRERLYFYDPEQEEVRSVGLYTGSPLVELKRLATELRKLHTVWDEPHIVNLILAGTVPPIPLARIELRKNMDWPAESRAHIVIDPATPPELPISVLHEVRQEVLPKGSKRTKSLSRKHLELAVFAERKRGEPDKPWAAMLSEWNTEVPDWAYKDKTAEIHFSRDVRAAWTRVTGKTWA